MILLIEPRDRLPGKSASRSRAWMAATVVSVLALVSACGSSGAQSTTAQSSSTGSGQVLRIALASSPVGLDPESVADNEAGFVMATVFDGLTSYAPGTTTVKPGLATSWTISPDGKQYIFTLRKGVTFQDGTPFNAQAVVAWLDRILNKKNPYYVPNQKGVADFFDSFTFGNVVKYKALSANKVEIDLSKPNAEFLEDLAMVWTGVTSPAATKKYGYGIMKHPVGTGPFSFVKWVQGQYIELKANPSYWGGKPKVGEIIFQIIPESSTRLLDLEKGKVQIVADVPPHDVGQLQKNANVRILTQPGLAVNGISLPVQIAPFNSLAVRQALNYAVSKAQIDKNLFFGLAKPMNSPDSPDEWSYAPQTPYQYNLTKAKQLMAKAGYAKGFTATLYTYPSPRGYDAAGGAKVAEAVQADLAKIGVKLNIQQMDFTSFLAKIRSNSFQAMASTGWSGDNGDPDDFMEPLYGCNGFLVGNSSHFCNKTVDSLFGKGILTTAQAQRKPIYAHLESIIWQQAPWIFLNYETQVRAESVKVHGYKLNPTEMFFDMQNVSLSK